MSEKTTDEKHKLQNIDAKIQQQKQKQPSKTEQAIKKILNEKKQKQTTGKVKHELIPAAARDLFRKNFKPQIQKTVPQQDKTVEATQQQKLAKALQQFKNQHGGKNPLQGKVKIKQKQPKVPEK